jgi:DNA-binding CsgD family transcriptional regulator
MRALLRASRGLHAYSTAATPSPIAPAENGATGANGGVDQRGERNGKGNASANTVADRRGDARAGAVGAEPIANRSADQNIDRGDDAVQRKRRLIAMFCKMMGDQVVRGEDLPSRPPAEPLSPRQRQTLELLLTGHAEKQIAARLDISRHTVHVYVKSLYKSFGVCSRAELLARWVQR